MKSYLPAPYPILPIPEILALCATALFLCRSNWTGAFAYEFSSLLAVASFLVFAIGTVVRLSAIEDARPLTSADRVRAAFGSFLSLWAPLVMVLLASIRIPTCRYGVGFVWFLLLPVPSALFGAASGIWATTLRTTSVKRAFAALLPALAFCLLTAWELYLGPGLSFLNPAIGYFAGPIYDEWIPIRTPIVTYRIFTLFLSLILIVTATRRSDLVRFGSAFAVATLLILRGPLGWSHDQQTLDRALPARLSGRTVELHFAPSSFSFQRAYSLLRTLDDRADRIASEIGLNARERSQAILIYLYPNPATKYRLTGVRHTAIGNPIRRTVHLLASESLEFVTHEMVHVVAGPLGVPGLRLSLRVGLLEGLATGVQRYQDDLSVHEWARAMQKLNLLPSMAKMMKPTGFWGESAGRAYLAAGSFCRWLLDSRGAYLFQRVYRGADFGETYRVPLASLVEQWEQFLRTVPLSAGAVRIADSHLRAKPVTERRCPHDVADAVERGYGCWGRKDLPGAIGFFGEAWRYSGEIPSTTLRLARAEARSRNWVRVEELARLILSKTESSTSERASARALLGDSAAVRGNLVA
ncbi:MAG: hypothetical protein V1495_09250, partial [Pseudomonadota bacterium]